VICIDEGQRIEPTALSALKNALQHLDCYLVVLSVRLLVDAGNAVASGRAVLDDKGRLAEGDFGASRFFITGNPMGPFQNENEAATCIQRRLEGNIVSFDDAVSHRIARIAAFLPREVISVASQVYSFAASERIFRVDLDLLDRAFRGIFRSQYLEAVIVCANISEGARSALTGLLSVRGAATAEQIVRQIFPSASPQVVQALVGGTAGELARLADTGGFVRRAEDKFEFTDPVRSYALKLVLGGGE
jgi:hypothetical protein